MLEALIPFVDYPMKLPLALLIKANEIRLIIHAFHSLDYLSKIGLHNSSKDPIDMISSFTGILGFYLGKFIYIMDAYEDLSEDKKKNRYNPLKQISEKEDYEERMVQILRMMIAESTARFEQLPCLVDVDILRNILYDGVWNRYNQIQRRIQEQNQEQMKKSKKSEEKK